MHPYFDRVKKLPKMWEKKNAKKNPRGYNKLEAPANNLIDLETVEDDDD